MAIIATKVDALLPIVGSIEGKVDNLDAKMQRVEGVVAVVRWIGLGGVCIAVVALLKSFGVEVGK